MSAATTGIGIQISVDLEPSRLRRAQKMLRQAPQRVDWALSRAVNRTLTRGRKEASQAVRKVVNLKAGVVKDTMSVLRATRKNPTGKIVVKRKPMPLRDYGARQTKKGVTVKVRKDQPRELHRAGFILPEFGGHVFERRKIGGKRVGRFPIDKMYGPTVVGVMDGEPSLLDGLMTDIDTFFNATFDREINFELSRLGAK